MPRNTHTKKAQASVPTVVSSYNIGLLLILTLCAVASLAAITPASASAVTDSEELGKFGSEGAGAGQFLRPRGMASDPVTGHLYVADSGNRRIDEFTAWGDFVKAWGWGVVNGNEELQTCTTGTGCVEGHTGSGKGQFSTGSPFSLAVDNSGNVYALDFSNHRVQKFTSTGQFVLMFGGGVDKTTDEDICTEASGDECQAGAVGTGQGEFTEGRGLAISQTGTILVGDEGRIEEFKPDGSFKSELKVPPGIVDGIAPDTADPDLYAMFRGQDDVHKLNSSGTELGSLKVHAPLAIAIDTDGNLHVAHRSLLPEGNDGSDEVAEFNSSGTEVLRCCIPPGGESGRLFELSGLATNGAGDLYVANLSSSQGGYITFLGPPPLKYGPPPKVPPTIDGQFSTSVDSTSATLKAQINPNFWADTHFYLEYGPEPCDAGPCAQFPAAPGQALAAGGVKQTVTSSGVVLTGLTPHATYHYRFVAKSGGGGPVFGPDRTFTTFAQAKAPEPCANDAFRAGPSANLPDCRAYEMVSPLDKNNGDITALLDITGYETHLNQAAADGEALTYSSYRAFGGAEGGPYISQYIARRDGAGWASEALGAPLDGNFYGSTLLEDEFKAFSPDLCHSWLLPAGESILAVGEIAGFPNLYRRENCPKGYEALTTVKPPILDSRHYIPELQGFSVDGAKAVLRVLDNLTLDSPAQPPACDPEGANCQTRLYEASGGTLAYVCVFPEEISAKAEAEFPNCSAGSSGREVERGASTRLASVSHAMSEDGSRIYWSASTEPSKPGKIYLRVNGTTTLKVTEAPGAGQTTKPAQFWGASVDGSRALYEVEDPDQKNPTPKDKSLYLYDIGVEAAALIAPKVSAVVATSEDLSRIYFVSEEVLAGTTGASGGKENLYLHEAGGNTFIARLSNGDVAGLEIPSDGAMASILHVARATPDGARLAFISTENLTGFDNSDLASGEADSEVFTYDAETETLDCVSCSPAGARPAGRNIQAQASNHSLWTAATIPAPQAELNVPRALSNDGNRLFFTSYTDLLPSDTTGKADVYEWEAAGSGSCTGEADPDYYPANGGCLFLISSGESPSDSVFIDTAANGRDVFFTTNASLLPQDPGLIDVYDARVGGGFPPPQTPLACEGEACQSPTSAPNDPTPASASFRGAGNLKGGPRARCGKGKARSKGRCVAKKKHKRNKRAHHRAAKSDRKAAL